MNTPLEIGGAVGLATTGIGLLAKFITPFVGVLKAGGAPNGNGNGAAQRELEKERWDSLLEATKGTRAAVDGLAAQLVAYNAEALPLLKTMSAEVVGRHEEHQKLMRAAVRGKKGGKA